MQFLKILFWVALAVLLVLFAQANWQPVTLKLWGGLEADVKLPVLVLAAFLLGFLPMLILHRARLWSLRRRIDLHERQAAVAGAAVHQSAPSSNSPTGPSPDAAATSPAS